MAIAPPAARYTHDHDGDLVVFLIGMTVNRWWRVRAWWPVFTAMPAMLRELYTDSGSGLLGHRMTLGAGGPVLVQYWASHDQLTTYARDAGRAHRPAWTAFNTRARSAGGSVGIWHETYQVTTGGHESVYSSTPVRGLAAATSAVAAGGGRRD
jgi:hypothetical protein